MEKKSGQFWVAMLILLFILVNASGTPFNICDDIEYVIDAETADEIECDAECERQWGQIWANETATAEATK